MRGAADRGDGGLQRAGTRRQRGAARGSGGRARGDGDRAARGGGGHRRGPRRCDRADAADGGRGGGAHGHRAAAVREGFSGERDRPQRVDGAALRERRRLHGDSECAHRAGRTDEPHDWRRPADEAQCGHRQGAGGGPRGSGGRGCRSRGAGACARWRRRPAAARVDAALLQSAGRARSVRRHAATRARASHGARGSWLEWPQSEGGGVPHAIHSSRGRARGAYRFTSSRGQ
mmetsp:Transcript_45689/g.126846  ORF Transcript_45689/g.126846 Transcript_45689/m.126846 type:complete len:232 (-) Transcript_45689:127-822(-)